MHHALTPAACVLALTAVVMEAGAQMPDALAEMPEGYHLQRYDDCGAPGRQPHIVCGGVHEYAVSSVNADRQARSVAWGWTEVQAVYDDLDPALEYVVAVTYANEPFNDRAQSLWANDTQLHGPHPLPRGGTERLIFRIPTSETQDGALTLRFRLEAQVNVVVSVVELWAAAPPPVAVHLLPVWALVGDVRGEVLDLSYGPLPGAAVRLETADDARAIASATADEAGAYSFPRRALDDVDPAESLVVVAQHAGVEARSVLPPEAWHFKPVRYRPIPSRQAGLKRGEVPLDGDWRIHPDPSGAARDKPLDADGWESFRVPGQWLQQGYDLPQDQAVAVAREFTIPSGWRGRRICARFEVVHAGTRYWLNGQLLGYSENLFTPVEWDLTDHVVFGRPNRLDLEMTVDTASERLSHSSGYAFHNLGGIDRSVRLFALPDVHVRDLRVAAGLDDEYRDGVLALDMSIDSSADEDIADLSVTVTLRDADGKRVRHSMPRTDLSTEGVEGTTATIHAVVPDPLKWSAEKPNLYDLRVELGHGDRVIETIERKVGFREVEVRGSQLYVNGKTVKLAGACRHEIDPLTGRADTARHAARDVELLKDANLNYIRTAHYPPTRELLDAADRLGMYVEVEAPFCWVHGEGDADDLGAVLTPTSAMIDYCHHHPSVILWSVANESQFNSLFEASAEVCKDLDPTRPTTFNNPDPKRICDIANLHYAPMPYDQHLEGDPRPIILGEYNFPVCHEQTDVRINPGLRELWGHGHGIPDSYWGWACAQSFEGPHLRPGTPPGTWSHITRSERIVGGAIWAAFDEPFYLPDGRDVGYAWRHGFWGLIDAWRRPKPEWWLAKLIFSPVWFPERRVRLSEGATAVVVPVENRYTFTELGELEFTWRMGSRAGRLTVDAPPGSTGEVEIPIPPDVEQGDLAIIDVHDAAGALVTVAAIQLGDPRPGTIPIPNAGPPSHSLANGKWKIEGDRYGFSIDAESAEFEVDSDARRASVLDFPALHLTRYDFADLAPNEKPYEVLPRAETRVVESVAVQEEGTCLAITVRDRYEGFDGSTTWRIDRSGVGEISYDYAYHGEELNAREIGVRLTLPESCDELQWRRWSEWGVYPEDSISRTEGVAKARRDPALGESRRGVRPDWPWSLDETELGTNDFRSVKLNIYEAALRSATGAGVGVRASADAHVRACLDGNGVKLHLLKECRLGPVVLRDGDRLAGRSAVQLLAP